MSLCHFLTSDFSFLTTHKTESILETMKIIDAHAHAFETLTGFGADGELRAIGDGKGIWATGKEQKIVPDGYGDKSFTIESLWSLVEKSDVEKIVLMQGGFLGFANEYVAASIKKYPGRVQGAGTFDPWCRNSKEIFDYLINGLKFKIFKFEVSTGCGIMGSHPDFPLDMPMMMDIYKRIESIGGVVVFDLGSPGDGSHQAGAIKNIASECKSLPVVICHLGSFKLGHEAIFSKEIEVMNRENIFFDLAALYWKVRPEEYPFPTAQHYVKEAKRVVGVDRLMWGSDAPSTVCKLSYDKQIEYIAECFAEKERESVFYNNANKLYLGL